MESTNTFKNKLLLLELESANKACDNYYYESTNNGVNYICEQCNSDCLKCSGSGSSECTSCTKSISSHEYFFLVSGSQGMCSSSCPTNYYYPLDQTTQYYCKSCDASCFKMYWFIN